MANVFVGVGSNVGQRAAHLGKAGASLKDLPRTSLIDVSPIYETPPLGPVTQGPYLNAVVQIWTTLSPRELLKLLSVLEAQAGRVPLERRVKWGPRELDLDILLYDQLVLSEPGLTIPHPFFHQRWFVLRPLADLDGQRVHPTLGRSVEELLHELEEREGVTGRRWP